LIYCFAWRCRGGFLEFELQTLHYILTPDGKPEKRFAEDKHFKTSYVTEEELVDQFLAFLKEKLYVSEWVPFVEAFRSLYFGGASLTFPPRWRLRQLARATKPNG
jgi:hypothetical protein